MISAHKKRVKALKKLERKGQDVDDEMDDAVDLARSLKNILAHYCERLEDLD